MAILALSRNYGLIVTIDERIEALTTSLELLTRDREADRQNLVTLTANVQHTSENVAELMRIAEMHMQVIRNHTERIDKLERKI